MIFWGNSISSLLDKVYKELGNENTTELVGAIAERINTYMGIRNIYVPLEEYLVRCADKLKKSLDGVEFVEQIRSFGRIRNDDELIHAILQLVHEHAGSV